MGFIYGIWTHESKRHDYNFSHSRNIQRDSSVCGTSDEHEEANFARRLPRGHCREWGLGTLKHTPLTPGVPWSPPHRSPSLHSCGHHRSRFHSRVFWGWVEKKEESCLSIILATLLSNIFPSKNRQTLQKPILFGSTKNRVASYTCIIYILFHVPSHAFCLWLPWEMTYYT